MREGEGQGKPPIAPAGLAGDPASLSRVSGDPSRGDEGGNRISLRFRMLRRLLHVWFWLSRGMTMGVRAIVRDEAGRVFLVRHSYVPGWHLPGGGIEHGQSAEAALAAELREEGNIELLGDARLLGVYLNLSASRRDHVLLYLVEHFRQTAPREPDREIAEAGFFPIDALSPGTTLGTKRRLAEFATRARPDAHW